MDPTKPIKIEVIIFEDALKWLRANVPHMEVDRVASVFPVEPFNPDGTTRYRDQDADTTKNCTVDDHIEGLRKLATMIEHDELHVGMLHSAYELVDPAAWDVEVVDAYYQLVYYGEIIYG